MPRQSARPVGAVSSDGTGGHFVASPVRKERLRKSTKELEEEAARVLHQVDRIDCVTTGGGVYPEKFYTLPHRKKKKEPEFGSLDRRLKRKSSSELTAPKKPPRTFASIGTPQTPQKVSIFDVFKKEKKVEPKKSSIKRSVSDASNSKAKVFGPDEEPFRKRSGSDIEEVKSRKTKKQLSPIIEITQREDYFHPLNQENKENIRYNDNIDLTVPVRKKKKDSITEQLKKFIDEVDEELYKETGVRVKSPEESRREPQPIIIDVDKAEKISTKSKKFKDTKLGKKLKSITHRKNKTNESNKIKKLTAEKINEVKAIVKEAPPVALSKLSTSPSPRIKAAIENLERGDKHSPTMIHSSQKPAEKLPLTKGRTVDPLVKRLSNDSCSPPPLTQTNILISPHGPVQHNNNQPFSYTRGVSPEKYLPNETNPGSPVIYAQVVCGSNGSGPAKQTVHTTFTNGKRHPHSDSDEGLGGEEHSGFSRSDKPVTRFRDSHRSYFDEVDKFKAESPITPRFRNSAYINGYSNIETKYNEYSKAERNGYFDSSNRGRGDGMDAKRRESLTEPFETGFGLKPNGRTDLSARRDLLESRITRRLNDNTIRTSPEYLKNSTPTNVYISESSYRHYRSGSTSPTGYTEKYMSETRTDKSGKPITKETNSKKYFGEPRGRIDYDPPMHNNTNGYHYNGFDSEPKSFDSQVSDYRSSPENRQFEVTQRYSGRNDNRTIHKDRTLYKSTPEIRLRTYQDNQHNDSYHDSLKREKTESRVTTSKFKTARYIDDNDRKEKFVDSGIENDCRRDSGDNFRVTRPSYLRKEYSNESEDEGFASSLLIASERQHTEDSINSRRRDAKGRGYDSDKREDDPYRNMENMEYKNRFRSNDYAPRERSIDDGSHYDPRLDKEFERSTLKKVERKPPKPEKKSGLEKVKSLFTRDSKKKKEKQSNTGMVPEESLRARYIEYKGREPQEPKYKKNEVNGLHMGYDYIPRRRIRTPSPSPTRGTNKSPLQRNGKPVENGTHGSWFKSLDRLARKKTKKDNKEAGNYTCSGTEEESSKPTPTKNLRFFGDTDIESNDSLRQRAKSRNGLNGRIRSQSTRDLHNISEELNRSPELGARKNGHKSMTNISESSREIKGSRSNLKPPMSPTHRVPRDTSRQDFRDRGRRRKNEVSSVESSTEGDSSQQSQRSIVYLHAATVGDIPGPGYLRNGRRAASREELASNSSSRIQPHVKTLSRSFSVLAPWRPRHPREGMDLDYSQYPKPMKNGKYEQKTAKSSSSRKDNSSTLKKKAQETRKNQSNSTLNRKSRSKENLSSSQTLRRSIEELSKGSSSTLYKKKERLPRENSRYSRDKEDKKMSSKSLLVESLGSHSRNGRKSREEARDISRSISMPRDPEKSAGWFKIAKKNKTSGNTQRL